MKTFEMIRKLCNKQNISISELARRIGQTPQNFRKKLNGFKWQKLLRVNVFSIE